MAASYDSDEEDDYVTLGTPLTPYEEDEAVKKPFKMADMVAKDKQGRQRFHGAFTGGFSAGFFNSVGSKEGFTPSTFVSSRSKPGEKQVARPEDFMDDEDVGEFGIAPRKFATSADFTSQERNRKRENLARAMTSGTTVIPGEPALLDLVVPEHIPVGVKLLKKMGWRPGLGVGPRIQKKKKKKSPKPAGARVYGCSLPTDSGDEDSDEFAPENVTFAPKDTVPISFTAKDDLHGIGYRGLDPSLALTSGRFTLFDSPAVGSSGAKSGKRGKKGIRGQAFGVGAFEDEDEDIYALDSMSNYDMTMEIDDSDRKFGWTAPKQHDRAKAKLPLGYVGKLLEGFTLSSNKLKPKTVFPRPQLPKGFRPFHHMKAPAAATLRPLGAGLGPLGSRLGQEKKHTALSRSEALGETPVYDSVFDLISSEDKARMEAAKMEGARVKDLWTIKPQAADSEKCTSTTQPESSPLPPNQTQPQGPEPSDKGHNSAQPPPPLQPSPSAGGSGGLGRAAGNAFKPFVNDPDKQARYDNYLRLIKAGHKDPFGAVASCAMMAWEKEREKEEFARAARFYKPLSCMIASRFTTAKYADDVDTADVPAEEDGNATDQTGAAQMKMFGRLTRGEFEWHPDKLVCKRFNVPDPYPSSAIVGLPTVKRDKLSIFNFLNFEMQADFAPPPPEDAPPPLAIEAPPTTQDSSPSSQPEVTQSTSVQASKTRSRGRLGKKPSIFSVLFEDDAAKKKPSPDAEADSPVPPHRTTPPPAATEPALPSAEEPGTEPTEMQEEQETAAAGADAPPPDLFRAIFKNSDSEMSSSESSDEDEEMPQSKMEAPAESSIDASAGSSSTGEVSAPGLVSVGDSFPTSAQGSGARDSLSAETVSDQANKAPPVSLSERVDSRSAANHSRDMPSDEDDGVYGPPLPPPSTSLSGLSSRATEGGEQKLSEGGEHGGESTPVSGGGEREGVGEPPLPSTSRHRDSPCSQDGTLGGEAEEAYGPALPPPRAFEASETPRESAVVDLTGESWDPHVPHHRGRGVREGGIEVIDLTRSSKKHKHKDRSRERSRNRSSDGLKDKHRGKDKAKKSKKSKHKKQKAKKERHKEKKKRRESYSSESSETD